MPGLDLDVDAGGLEFVLQAAAHGLGLEGVVEHHHIALDGVRVQQLLGQCQGQQNELVVGAGVTGVEDIADLRIHRVRLAVEGG